jgi:NADH:ubiquinone oxidoreductase subunit C
MMKDELKDYIASNFAEKLTALDTGRFDPMFEVKPEQVVEVSRLLREDNNLNIDFLCNIAAVDTRDRFEVVYSVASTTKNIRLDFKATLPHDNPEIDSVQTIWAGANWHEREMWELFGINIRNHDNLTRFLLPDEWDQGFPMRKDWDAPDFIRMPEPEV